jgi:hypothetical protein
VQKEGNSECGDWSALAGAQGGLALACRDTALQHPKEFEVSKDKIILHLFSSRAGEELDFRTASLVKKWDLTNWYTLLRGHYKYKDLDIPKTVEKVGKYSSDAIGWSKTHELLVLPLASEKETAGVPRYSYLNTHPFFALAAPEWIYKSDVMGPLYPRDTQRFPEAERLIDATFQAWEQKTEDWGDFGFIDYFAGPHLAYCYLNRKYATPYRYSSMVTYTLRPDLWRIYARSGERRIREYAEATNLKFGDSKMAHWDGGGKTKGLFIFAEGGEAADPGGLPFYWSGKPVADLFCTADMNHFLWLYQLTGCRRAREFVEEYAEGYKRNRVSSFRPIMTMRMCAQTYSLTWDPVLRELAETLSDTKIADPDGALGLNKNQSGGTYGTTYKTQMDINGLLDAWQILGNQRFYDISMKVSKYWWQTLLGDWPIEYTNPQGRIGNFLYRETGDPVYPEMLALQVRQSVVAYDPEKGTVGGVSADKSTFVFWGIPYAEDLMVRTGADKTPVATWVAYLDIGYPVSIVAWKADQGTLDIDLAVPRGDYGAVGGVRVQPLQPPKPRWGQNLNILTGQSGVGNEKPFATIRIPKDAPECAYEILSTGKGLYIAAAHGRVPMVIYAPDYWKPALCRQYPPVKWYFNVPTNSQNAQIFFEKGTRLYAPDGKAFTEGRSLTNWVDLPADKPGLWAFEPTEIKDMPEEMYVRVRNLPPFFAARDPQSYFTPPIPWQHEKPFHLPEKPVPGTVYVPGAIETPENKALYLEAGKKFVLEGGGPHPSDNGTQFLPFKQGTIEFFFKPSWGTFQSTPAIPPAILRPIVTLAVTTGQNWTLTYYNHAREHSLKVNLTATLPVIIESSEWIHVAWVWGTEEITDSNSQGRVKIPFTRVYINGKGGNAGPTPAYQPRTLIFSPLNNYEAAYDELRISNIQRYTGDFLPPARDKELQLDEHTRALFHFNGNVQGESYGLSGTVMGKLK